MIPVECFFVLSALLFFIGVFGFITRRNLLTMLISVELILNAVDINFAAINRLLYPNGMEGMFMTLFVIGVAAAESAVAIAIIINVYRRFRSDSVESITNLKNSRRLCNTDIPFGFFCFRCCRSSSWDSAA